MSSKTIELEKVVIKFVGDSGDGMQLTGSQFTDTSALVGNDLATFPDFPAEIRAPKGTIPGVSGFQVQIGENRIYTAGDEPDVLVVMNAAALKANFQFLSPGKTLIVDTDSFKKIDLKKAGYDEDPLEDGSLDNFNVIKAPISTLTKESVKHIEGLDQKSIARSKNMFTLGMVYYMFDRPMNYSEDYIKTKFSTNNALIEGNLAALRAGYNYADTVEAISSTFSIKPAKMEAGVYRNILGNQAIAWGFMAAAENAKLGLFLGSYPITPASDILHELSKFKNFGVKTFQAEDEIAGICSAIGASYAGDLALTTTSGPGLALKMEALGLAIMTELPIVVVDVQRGGPSTGLPTKTEQSDLLQAIHGRNGESPAIVIAASTPSNCFEYAYMASKLALEHMTPVILLSDGYIANGSGPWKIPHTEDLPPINPPYYEGTVEDFKPYFRDSEKLSRYWAVPGRYGLEHRIGGLEKQNITGNISYEGKNHEEMCKIREEKVQRVANYIPEQQVIGKQEGDVLIVGWGGTYGALLTAANQLIVEGKSVGLAHFNYLYPMPKNTKDIFSKYKKIIVCELNLGQFVSHLRSTFPEFNYLQYNKVQGQPFTVRELTTEIKKHL